MHVGEGEIFAKLEYDINCCEGDVGNAGSEYDFVVLVCDWELEWFVLQVIKYHESFGAVGDFVPNT